MIRWKHSLSIGSLMFLVSAFGCGTKENVSPATERTQVANVAISKVTRSSIADYYQATGTVKAKTTTQVSANVLGRITALRVNAGDSVQKGEVLVEIDNRDAQANLQKAEAGLKEAQASLIEIDNSVTAASAAVRTADANRRLAEVTFGRYKELYQRKSVSGQEYDDALSKLSVATSELDRAKANVQTIISRKSQVNARIEQAKAEIANSKVYAGYARIASPVSGVIVKKFAETGAMASPGVPILSIEDNSQYRLEVGVEESRSGSVRIGNRVSVRIDAIGGGEIYGTVSEILPSADASSRSFTVKIDLPANASLRSGQYGLASFPTGQKDAIAVPDTAIVERGQLIGVFVVGPEGVAQFRIVTIGKRAEGQSEILSGLSEGDEIVISDTERIKDGAKVR